MSEIKLGQKGKDKVTGFEGIIVGKASYLYGCDQYCLSPSVEKKEMKLKDAHWFDEGRIEIIGRGVLPKEVQADKPGGPQPETPKGTY